jgi:hypothetical protein
LFRWIDIIAGWFFTSLFVIGISGLVRSDRGPPQAIRRAPHSPSGTFRMLGIFASSQRLKSRKPCAQESYGNALLILNQQVSRRSPTASAPLAAEILVHLGSIKGNADHSTRPTGDFCNSVVAGGFPFSRATFVIAKYLTEGYGAKSAAKPFPINRD